MLLCYRLLCWILLLYMLSFLIIQIDLPYFDATLFFLFTYFVKCNQILKSDDSPFSSNLLKFYSSLIYELFKWSDFNYKIIYWGKQLDKAILFINFKVTLDICLRENLALSPGIFNLNTNKLITHAYWTYIQILKVVFGLKNIIINPLKKFISESYLCRISFLLFLIQSALCTFYLKNILFYTIALKF